MNGDISRVTFDPLKHFTGVVTQQGRVQVDADENERQAILLHFLRKLAADLIGQHGGPEDLYDDPVKRAGLKRRNCGFAIIAAQPGAGGADPTFHPSELLEDEKTMLRQMITDKQFPLRICTGHYYVDGLLCENEDYRRYSQQPDLHRANDDQISKLANGTHLLYLDVWERHITALEDPSIREVALGGAETCARRKLIWQVRASGPTAPAMDSCTKWNTAWPDFFESKLARANRGKIRAKAKEDSGDDADACITSPEARYRGVENQLYRVEIHRSGPALNNAGSNREDAATFKWSRDNGTIVAALNRKDGDRLIVSGLLDYSRWFAPGKWVEIAHDALELNGRHGTMVRLAKVDGETLTIDPSTASGPLYQPQSKYHDLPISNLKVRRWDHKQPEDTLLHEGALTIEESVWIDLEDGVTILFEPPKTGENQYRSGDYWLIPARVVTGNVEWPTEDAEDPNDPSKTIERPKALPPHGIEHHYAPLAIITLSEGNITGVLDVRHKFRPLAACPTAALRTVEDTNAGNS